MTVRGASQPKSRDSRGACLFFTRHILWLFLLPFPAFSQTSEELFSEYEFNFDLPGARANGMGGTFIGTADDATASFANPAGLAFLNETAITVEWRTRRLDAISGNLEGIVNASNSQEPNVSDALNFLSFNFRWRGWYFGVFQFDYLDVTQRRRFEARSLANLEQRTEMSELTLNLEGNNRGVGVARRFGDFKLGVSANYIELKGRTTYRREGFIIGNETVETVFQSSIDDSDKAWGFNVGLHHDAHPKFAWGLVWRHNPKLDLQEQFSESFNGIPLFAGDISVPFSVPDVFGAGVLYRVRPDLRLSLDWQRVFYSEIVDKGFVITEDIATVTKENYSVNDVDEIHVGVEWLIPRESTVWAIRTGYFHNPKHPVRFNGDDVFINARFAGVGSRDENHVTLGLGWVLLNKFEVDVAANFWELGKEFKVSFIWRNK